MRGCSRKINAPCPRKIASSLPRVIAIVSYQKNSELLRGLYSIARPARLHHSTPASYSPFYWLLYGLELTSSGQFAFGMLASIATEDLTVKRIFIASNNGRRVNRWWFVLRAEENALKKLEESWDSLTFSLTWNLKPLPCFADSPSQPSQALQVL